MEDCDLSDREFKTAFIKKKTKQKQLNEIKENSKKQIKELMNKINEQKRLKLFLKKNQTDFLELKNSTNEIKHALEAWERGQTI